MTCLKASSENPTSRRHKVMDFAHAQDGLRMEMLLLAQNNAAGQTNACAMLWRANNQSLVVPASFERLPQFVRAARQSAQRGWPVVTRRTGGGIVPQGPGIVNLALVLPKDGADTIEKGYFAICTPLIEACANFGLKAELGHVNGGVCDGRYNLHVGGQKLVGTAQRRAGNSVLCQALILVDPELATFVGAASAFSLALGHPHPFRTEAHTRLAELIAGWQRDIGLDAFTSILAEILAREGFAGVSGADFF